MSAPSPAVRQTPVGIKLKSGYRTLITCTADPDISFWEKEVTPIGDDGGEPIDQTTMFNDTYETAAPADLIKSTPASILVAYDPAVRTQIRAIINVETTWTITYKDGSTEAFYGWLRTFMPQRLARGVQPMAEIEIHSSNFDPVNHVEAGPALASVAGT